MLLKASSEGFILALDLAEYLSKNFNLSFREAHHIVGSLTQNYFSTNEIFSVENIKKECIKITNKLIDIKEEDIEYFSNYKNILDHRISVGAPNKKDIEESIKECRQALEDINQMKDLILTTRYYQNIKQLKKVVFNNPRILIKH